jgi:hypothetical protein
MLFAPPPEHLQLERFPQHAGALDRHMRWAMDSAAFGETESAASELRDVHAICAEITDVDDFGTEIRWARKAANGLEAARHPTPSSAPGSIAPVPTTIAVESAALDKT